MFGTLGNTIKLLRTSARLLFGDRELLLFPVCAGISLLFVALYVLVAFHYGGTFDRITSDLHFHTADFIFLAIAYFGASLIIVYFSTALVAAAHYRLMGGSPDFRFGLEAANDRLGALVVWALIASTVGLVIRRMATMPGIIGRVSSFLAELAWGWATFLVIPVMVIEAATPLEAMRRSTEMFKETWGRALVANFGFGFFYVGSLVIAALPAAGLFFLTSSAGLAIMTGVVLCTTAAATVKSLETVFTVALYNYVMTGNTDGIFPDEFLRDAFVYKSEKGKFGPPPLPRRAAA